jgi:hypothetical protein
MKPASWYPAALALMLVAGPAIAQEAELAPGQPLVLEEFDVARDGDALLVPVTLQGKKYLFLVDTGTNANCVDSSLLFGPPREKVTNEAAGGPVTLNLYDPPDAGLGSFALRPSGPVLGVDLKHLRDGTGHEVCGVLGMAFLRNRVVRVDFDAGKLTFLKEVGPEPGRPVTLSYDEDGTPLVWVSLAGWVREPFIIDTGFGRPWCGSLKPNLLQSLANDRQLRVVSDSVNGTLGAEFRGRVGQGKGLTLAGFALPDPVFTENPRWNLLGLGYLSRFTVTFDFKKGVMYLKNGQRFGEPGQWNQTGLRVKRQGGQVVVSRLAFHWASVIGW